MWTCSAQTPPKQYRLVSGTEVRTRPGSGRIHPGCVRTRAFTLVELIVVISFLALLVLLAQTNLFGVLRRQTFRSQVQDFVSTMRMAAASAAESSHRYEMVIDLAEQSYLLREITSSDLSVILDEEIITQGWFGGNCRVSYVEFDDGDYTNKDKAKFRVGSAGWQYGGKIVFIDESEQPYAVMVNRLTPLIDLVVGDPALATPKTREEVPFL